MYQASCRSPRAYHIPSSLLLALDLPLTWEMYKDNPGDVSIIQQMIRLAQDWKKIVRMNLSSVSRDM